MKKKHVTPPSVVYYIACYACNTCWKWWFSVKTRSKLPNRQKCPTCKSIKGTKAISHWTWTRDKPQTKSR